MIKKQENNKPTFPMENDEIKEISKKNVTNVTNFKKTQKTPKLANSNNLQSKKDKKVNTDIVLRVTNVTNDTNVTGRRNKRNTKHNLTHALGKGDFEVILKALFPMEILTYNDISLKIKNSSNSVKTTINRHKEYFEEGEKKEGIKSFKLSPLANNYINQKIKEYEDRQNSIIERELEKKQIAKSTEDLILECKEYFNINKESIGEAIREGNNSFYLDFQNLSKYSPQLTEALMKKPEETLEMLETALEDTSLIKNPKIRLINIPNDCNLPIENIRNNHLNKLIAVEGRVVSISSIRPHIVSAKYECPSCGTIISVLQNEKKLREPSRCSCGRRGKFRLISKLTTDTARIILEDLQEKTDNPHSQRLNAFISKDLVNLKNIKNFTPGNEIKVIGILKEIPTQLRTGAISVKLDHALEILSCEALETEVNIKDFSEEEIKEIKNLSKLINKNGLKELTPSFAPHIFGYKGIKNAIILQLSNKRNSGNKKDIRNKCNILLIGDPGISKSELGKEMINITTGSRMAVGGGSSAVGITASVRKEEEGDFRIEPGALPLAREMLFLDELNNLDDEDKPKLQEAMNDQSVTINKASLHLTLKVTAGMLACANPIEGQFHNNKSVVEQFNIPSPILNRFDLIFVMRDNIENERDKSIAKKMIQRERGVIKPKYDKQFLRKFFVYIRQLKTPIINDKLEEKLSNLYSKSRVYKTKDLMINPRFLEALIRLIKASAKLRQSNEVEEKDIERAMEILSKSHYQIQEYKHFNLEDSKNA